MTTCLLLVLLSSAASDPPPPPGALVVKPGGSGAVPVTAEQQYPDKPGFIVIRPQRSSSPATPKLVGEPTLPRTGSTPPPANPKKGDDEKKDGRVVLEQGDASYLKGHKVGYYHVVVREYEREGKKFLYATKTQRLTVARFGQVVEQWGEDSTMETADGTVLTTRMRQGIGKDQMIQLTGQVSGKVLTVKMEGGVQGTQDVPWPEGVLGISREATLMKDRKPKPGESFDYLVYEGRLNRTVRITAQAKDFEEVVLVQGEKPRKMLKLVVGMEALKLENGAEFRLPPTTMWCDPVSFDVLKMETDMPMFGGKLVTLRTTKEVALRPPGKVPDLFDVQSIPLAAPIPTIHELAGVVYKVKLSGDVDPARAFATDARQEVKDLDAAAKTFELHVTAVRAPGAPAQKQAGPEYLSSSFFIDWDTDPVKAHARQAAADLPAASTAWQKARAVESYVYRNMKAAEFSQAMATCSNVARTLSGDCTEYAMLAAGMCRALGVPSRTAIGLIYAPDRSGKAYLAYHMWFEVFADGHWVALDATRGAGSVGPGHVKITDASWHEEKSFVPLLPVLTVLGASPKFEVVKTIAARR